MPKSYFSAALLFTAVALLPSTSAAAQEGSKAKYSVELTNNYRLVSVSASVVAKDGTLKMTPWGYPQELVPRGWAEFVEELQVRADGRLLQVTPVEGPKWSIDVPDGTPLELSYKIRLRHDEYDWVSAGGDDARPALLDGSAVWMTKALFIVPPDEELSAEVHFDAPADFTISTPWEAIAGNQNSFRTASLNELYNNTIVVGHHIHREITAGGMQVVLALDPAMSRQVTTITSILGDAIKEFANVIGAPVSSRYLVALRRNEADDGEAFTNSFVQLYRFPPDEARSIIWASTLVHELFHISTDQIAAEDQATVEWFNEGFTEYMASRTLARVGVIPAELWRQKVGFYLSRYSGTQIFDNEGPTLTDAGSNKFRNWRWIYGGGASIALYMDITIRDQTAGRAGLDEVFQYLHQEFGLTGRHYVTGDLLDAVNAVSGNDWTEFFASHITGRESLPPFAEALEKVGLLANTFVDEWFLMPVANPTAAQQELLKAIIGE